MPYPDNVVGFPEAILDQSNDGRSEADNNEPAVTLPFASTTTFGYVPAVTPLLAKVTGIVTSDDPLKATDPVTSVDNVMVRAVCKVDAVPALPATDVIETVPVIPLTEVTPADGVSNNCQLAKVVAGS